MDYLRVISGITSARGCDLTRDFRALEDQIESLTSAIHELDAKIKASPPYPQRPRIRTAHAPQAHLDISASTQGGAISALAFLSVG